MSPTFTFCFSPLKPYAFPSTGRIVLFTAALLGLPLTISTHAVADLPSPGSSHQATIHDITSADVLARLQLLQQEVDLIRRFMGIPTIKGEGLLITKTFLHENYFQAHSFWEKANRLSMEQTGQPGPPPQPVDLLHIRPFHVWTIVNACLQQLHQVKQHLGIHQSSEEPLQDETTSPADVFHAIVNVNRQMNLLLERPFFPRRFTGKSPWPFTMPRVCSPNSPISAASRRFQPLSR